MQEAQGIESEGGWVLWQVVAASDGRRARVERLLEGAGYRVVRSGVLPTEVRLSAVRAAIELSEAERSVLEAWLECDTNRQVAERLHVSVDTVKDHAKAILRALGVHSRHRALVEATRLGLIEVVPAGVP